ncbi:MAG: trypsin-like serine protease [Bdellovibrionota bacterium]
MGTSSKQKGWGTLSLLIMVVMISACAEKKKTAQATGSDLGQEQGEGFDYFSEECNPGQRAGIVNGAVVKQTDADSNRSVLLIWEDKKGEQHLCSSSLIDNQTLLTAAHCVNEAVKMQAVFYTDVSCGSGYKRTQHSIPIDKMIFHPDYKTDITNLSVIDENIDLGLVHLSRPAPADFPIFKISKNPEVLTSELYLYGFGITGTFSKDSMLLRKAIVQRQFDDGEPNSFFINNALIFGQKDGPGLCSGDSGGAVLMDDNGELVIASVNSEVFTGADDSSGDLCNNGAKTIVVYHYLESWIIPTLAKWGQSLN